MSILTDLKNQAVAEMGWDPVDDRNYTFVPYRYGRIIGDLNFLRTRRNLYELPVGGRFTLYTLNQLSPEELGLDLDRHGLRNWMTLEELSNHCNTVVQVYIDHRMLPLHSVHVRIDNSKEFLIAVNAIDNAELIQTEKPLHVRFFTNDWLANNTPVNPAAVNTLSTTVAAIEDAMPVLLRWQGADSGTGFLYHNGYLVDSMSVNDLQPGDTIMAHVDTTVVGTLDFALSELSQFRSTKDNINKVIVPLNLSSRTRQVPFDEVDFYIVGEGIYRDVPKTIGVFFDRLSAEDVRQLTHQDLAVNAERLYNVYDEHKEALLINDPKLRVVIRRTTTPHMLAPRLPGTYADQLYHLNAVQRKSQMVGPVAHFERWKVTDLENSGFSKWVHSDMSMQYASENMAGLYTYEELCRKFTVGLASDSTLFLDETMGQVWTAYPLLATCGGMSLAFDGDGKLIDAVKVPENSYGGSRRCPDNTASVMFIPGNLNPDASGWDRDTGYFSVADVFGEQYYWREADATAWYPAMEGVDYVINVGTGALQWDSGHNEHERMRRTIRDSSYRELDIEPELLHHPIDIFTITPPTDLPLSHLDVYVENCRLVEGVDFTLNYPKIQIHSKEYYRGLGLATVNVKIFYYGLPDQKATFRHYGWIRNRRMLEGFNTMGLGLAQEAWVDGGRTKVETFDLMESPDADVTHREGGLWERRGPVPAIGPWMEKVFDTDQTALKRLSYAVSRHLSREYDDAQHVFAPKFHTLFSPAVYTIVQAIRSKEIQVKEGQVSRASVAATLYDYQSILDSDMLQLDLDWDMINIEPFPHDEVIILEEYELAWLRIANEMFFHNRVKFNSFVTT